MTKRALMLLIAIPALLWSAWAFGAPEKTHKLTTVSLRKMADSLRAVIAADQVAYVEVLVRHQKPDRGPVAAVVPTATLTEPRLSDAKREPARLPGHAEMLRTAAQAIQKRGAEFSYTLRSLSPLDASNGPQTEVEQAGLEAVAKNPAENYYTEEELGGRSYFTAVYAQRAVAASCVECHNRHPQSPRRDLKPGDVMGAIVVRVPLEF